MSDVLLFYLLSLHHGLTQEKFGSEEVRLASLAPLPTIEATNHNKTVSLLFTRKIVSNSLRIISGSEDPDSLFRFLPLPGFLF